jgi:hypothetical protein
MDNLLLRVNAEGPALATTQLQLHFSVLEKMELCKCNADRTELQHRVRTTATEGCRSFSIAGL